LSANAIQQCSDGVQQRSEDGQLRSDSMLQLGACRRPSRACPYLSDIGKHQVFQALAIAAYDQPQATN
jgi:hypothetical protein